MKDDDAPKPNQNSGLSRRDFIKISSVGAALPLALGPTVQVIAETGQPQRQAMDEEEQRTYRTLLAQSDDSPETTLASEGNPQRLLSYRAP